MVGGAIGWPSSVHAKTWYFVDWECNLRSCESRMSCVELEEGQHSCVSTDSFWALSRNILSNSMRWGPANDEQATSATENRSCVPPLCICLLDIGERSICMSSICEGAPFEGIRPFDDLEDILAPTADVLFAFENEFSATWCGRHCDELRSVMSSTCCVDDSLSIC